MMISEAPRSDGVLWRVPLPPAVGAATLWAAVAVALIALGLFGRLYGLGQFPLATDEYYFAQSVRAIVAHGIPSLDSGGYYPRGILVQYLTALAVVLVGDNELAYRLPAAVFSIATVPLAYLYGRRVLGKVGGLALAAMLIVSAWEIEFARFARMYAPLQFFTLLFALALDNVVRDHDRRWTYAPHAVLLVGSLVHEFVVLLVPLLFVPVLTSIVRHGRGAVRRTAALTLAALTAAILCYAVVTLDIRDAGVINRFPAGFQIASDANWRLPIFPFFPGVDAGIAVVLAGLAATAAIFLFAGLRYSGRIVAETDLLGFLLLLSTALHQFLISGFLMLVIAARLGHAGFRAANRRGALMVAAALLLGIGWIAYAVTSGSWVDRTFRPGYGLAKALIRTFFGWPGILEPIVVPWLEHLPLIAACAAVAFCYQVAVMARTPVTAGATNPALILVVVFLAFSARISVYTSIRYSFFVYPLVLAVILLSATQASATAMQWWKRDPRIGSAVGLLACLMMFLVSGDFHLKQITGVATPDVRLRLGEFERYQGIWYDRWDYESPAAVVNARSQRRADKVLVVGQPPVSYYLRVRHAVYYDRAETRFYNVSRAGGTIDLWSNQRLLSTPEELRDYTRCAANVWIIRAVSREDRAFEIEHVWNGRLKKAAEAYRSIDGRLEARRVELATETACDDAAGAEF